MKPIIEVANLAFSYGNQPVFNNLNLSVNKGEFLGIIGANGSGKSTLLKLILGFLRPQEGFITINDTPVAHFNQWQRLGYLSQKATAFNSSFPATLEEVVKAGSLEGSNFFKPWVKIEQAPVIRALELVGLAGMEKALMGELSGGQQQRAFLARILVREPELIILDEPTVGLDPQGYHQLAELLAGLNKGLGLTIVVVTHQLSCMIEHFNRLVYLENGRLSSYQPQEFLAKCQYA